MESDGESTTSSSNNKDAEIDIYGEIDGFQSGIVEDSAFKRDSAVEEDEEREGEKEGGGEDDCYEDTYTSDYSNYVNTEYLDIGLITGGRGKD